MTSSFLLARERERETQEPLLFLPPSLQSVPAFSPNIALFFAHLLARPPLPSTCTTMGVWKTQKPMRRGAKELSRFTRPKRKC